MKKWYATINGNDDSTQAVIKIGIVTVQNSEYGIVYQIVASNNDNLEIAEQNSTQDALEAIRLTWGQWKSFSWID